MRKQFVASKIKVIVGCCVLVGMSACKPKNQATLESHSTKQPTKGVIPTGTSCLDDAAKLLLVNQTFQTDTELLKDIYKNEMYLDDMDMEKFPQIKQNYDAILENSSDLAPMLNRIIFSINTKQFAIQDFLCTKNVQSIIAKAIQENTASFDMIKRTIHHTFLLNEVTKNMSAYPQYMTNIMQHIKNKRLTFNIRPGHVRSALDIFKITGECFMPAKTIAMDICIGGVESDRKERRASDVVYPLGLPSTIGLSMNISEAIVTDKVHGFHNNALAGIALVLNPPPDMHITSSTSSTPLLPQYHVPEDWDTLYETWNFAFITGNIPNLNIVYPKLLLPVVIGAERNDYLVTRMEALWLTINYTLFAQVKGINIEMPYAKELGKEWGKVNAKYAYDFAKKHNKIELRSVKDLLQIPANYIKDKMVELISHFSKHYSEE